MRVLRPGGPHPTDCHDPPGPRPSEPRSRDKGRRADDVRRADPPVLRRCRGGSTPPRWRGIRHDRSTQRPTLGSAEPRPSNRDVPTRFEWGRRVPSACRRAADSRWATRCAAVPEPDRRAGGDPRMTAQRQTGLGRGLGALIPQRTTTQGSTDIPISRIRRNPWQPRRRIDAEALEALAASIQEHGVIQPVLVTETIDGYQLVAGERRLRAAQLAGLDRIPAVVRQLADREHLELALVENVQRADLGPMEEANAYRQLIADFGL